MFISMYGTVAIAGKPAQWEYEGTTSTGEKVYLDLNSIELNQQFKIQRSKNTYFFSYKVGENLQPLAFTNCDGIVQVITADEVTFEPLENTSLVRPKPETTRKMLNRVCLSHRQQDIVNSAYVFDPPSNVRAFPNGEIVCSVKAQKKINIYGSQDSWFYTDVCGKMGVIHSSQIRF